MSTSTQPATVLEKIAAGDSSAVDECVQRYGGLVWSLAKRQLASTADAEDLTQEIFVELWQKAHTYDRSKSSEETFIAMIARRRIIDRRRRAGARPETVSVEAIDLSGENETNMVELKDEAAKASDCLEKLSVDQRKVLKLSIHGGASHSQISERLNMPLGSVKSFARRGLIQLRACMLRGSAYSGESMMAEGGNA